MFLLWLERRTVMAPAEARYAGLYDLSAFGVFSMGHSNGVSQAATNLLCLASHGVAAVNIDVKP